MSYKKVKVWNNM